MMEAEKDTVISRDQDLAPLCTSMFWSQPPGGGKGPSLSRTATHPALLQWDPTGIRRHPYNKLGFRHLLDRKTRARRGSRASYPVEVAGIQSAARNTAMADPTRYHVHPPSINIQPWRIQLLVFSTKKVSNAVWKERP